MKPLLQDRGKNISKVYFVNVIIIDNNRELFLICHYFRVKHSIVRTGKHAYTDRERKGERLQPHLLFLAVFRLSVH